MLTREWLQAFVPIGVLSGSNRWAATGAGVLFADGGLLWLVTADHVVRRAGPERIAALLSKEDGTALVIQLGDVQREAKTRWIEDGKTDLAATPMPVPPGARLKVLSEQWCIRIADVVPSMPCYTVGCPYGMHGVDPSKPAPLVLDGVISGVSERDGILYTTAPTFPGNSGGPLVVFRSPISPTGAIVGDAGRPTLLFAGIVVETVLVSEPSSSHGMPPLHLGAVRCADSVLALVRSPEARELAETIRERNRAGR